MHMYVGQFFYNIMVIAHYRAATPLTLKKLVGHWEPLTMYPFYDCLYFFNLLQPFPFPLQYTHASLDPYLVDGEEIELFLSSELIFVLIYAGVDDESPDRQHFDVLKRRERS